MKDHLEISNSAFIPDPGSHSRVPGQIYRLTNESTLSEGYYSEPLTQYIIGFMESDENPLLPQLNFVAPPVKVARRFEYKKIVEAEEYYSETDDARDIGSDFKMVEYNQISVNSCTLNKGLAVRIDMDFSNDPVRDSQIAAQRLTERLIRNDLKRAIALHLANAGNTSSHVWNTSGVSQPDGDMMMGLALSQGLAGIPANRVAIERRAWILRRQQYINDLSAGASLAILDGPPPGRGGSSNQVPSGISDEDRIAKILELPPGSVMIIDSPYRASNLATNYSFLAQSSVIIFRGSDDEATSGDISNVRRFVTPTESGPFRVYSKQYVKYIDVSVEHYSQLALVNSQGIIVLTVS